MSLLQAFRVFFRLQGSHRHFLAVHSMYKYADANSAACAHRMVADLLLSLSGGPSAAKSSAVLTPEVQAPEGERWCNEAIVLCCSGRVHGLALLPARSLAGWLKRGGRGKAYYVCMGMAPPGNVWSGLVSAGNCWELGSNGSWEFRGDGTLGTVSYVQYFRTYCTCTIQ
jgi:hypothetical protein